MILPWLRPASRSACAPARAALLVDLILAGPEVGFPEPGPDPRADRLAAFNQLLAPSGRQATAQEYALLAGPVFARLFFDRAEVTSEFTDTVVTGWLLTLDRRYDLSGQGGDSGEAKRHGADGSG
jgi:hypothetical protein